jgi:homoserine kinase
MYDFTKKIKVYSPASVANVVCGFDTFGFAVHDIYDELVMRLIPKREIIITNKDNYNLPTEPEKNVLGVALLALLEEVKGDIGFEIESNKLIKPGSGIGSSAASAGGVIVGANYLLGKPFTQKQLIEFAMAGEALASGSKHADNIAPCICGGFTIVRTHDPLDVISIDAPPMFVTIVHPQIEVKTSDARNMLPTEIPFKKAIQQWGNIAAMVAGLMKGDYELISRSMQDVLVEPIRQKLIPGYAEFQKIGHEEQAIGGGISGSGPSMFMLSKEVETAKRIEQRAIELYSSLGLPFHTFVTTLNKEGVRIEEV